MLARRGCREKLGADALAQPGLAGGNVLAPPGVGVGLRQLGEQLARFGRAELLQHPQSAAEDNHLFRPSAGSGPRFPAEVFLLDLPARDRVEYPGTT
ncbi:MAG: hypothetical protein L0Z62_36120 [Gemmataceae bacterium]|nr:hypothetical protein [Gemmataceae bacterium]